MRVVLITSIIFLILPVLAQQFFDDPAGVRSFHDSRIGRAMGTRQADLAMLLKNEKEVDEYIKCYLAQRLASDSQADARQKEFNSIYKPFIDKAVQSFQIPYSLSACVMFRETFLDNDAVSPAGAKTIAQFTPNTYDTLKNHFQSFNQLEDSEKEFIELQKDPNFDVLTSRNDNFFVRCTQHSQGEGPHVNMVSGTKKVPGKNVTYREDSRNICRDKLRDFEINRILMSELKSYLYNSSRNMNKEQRKRYFPNTSADQWPSGSNLLPPTSFAQLKQNPMWLAAMNIFYLKRMTMIADAHFNNQGFKKSNDYLGYLTVIAGSYNRGPAALNNIVSQANGSIKTWCQSLKTSEETNNYMLSIKRCMAKGSNYAMTGMRESSACKKTSPGVKDIEDPCETLLVPGDGKVYDLTDPNEPVICDPSKNQDCRSYQTDQ